MASSLQVASPQQSHEINLSLSTQEEVSWRHQ